MKRFWSFLVSLALLAAWTVPALADDSHATETTALNISQQTPSTETTGTGTTAADIDQQLADVTAQVKQTLSIDDNYTTFYGNLQDSVSPTWNLNWSDDVRSLSVEVDLDGKIMYIYRWYSDESSDQFYGFDPAFPSLKRSDAETKAETWLAKLMGEHETARIETVKTILGRNGYYRFSGTVLLNELPSPISFQLELDGNGIYSYSRSDGNSPYVGGVPTNLPNIDMQVGEEGLFSAVSMELYYVSDSKGNARLQYVPAGPETIVDAMGGDVVDMDALYASVGGENGARGALGEDGSMMDSSGAGAILTETEFSSIENYAGVLPESDIDALLRAMDALGLDGFTLAKCSYNVDSETGDVTASLHYTKEMTEDNLYGYSPTQFAESQQWGDSLTIQKTIYVNAKTGSLRSVSTNYPLWTPDESMQVNEEDTLSAAEAFLKEAAPELFAETERNTLSASSEETAFLFARTHDGFFFPENYLRVEINPASGTVDSYAYIWDDNVIFAGSEGIISEDDARTTYADALKVVLGYAAWPVDITLAQDEAYARYLDWGYVYLEQLRLAYFYDGKDNVCAVDALSGEIIPDTSGHTEPYVYEDLDGVEEKDIIEQLGEAGVGFDGGKFLPDEVLTQRDAVVLLLRASGNDADTEDDEWLCERAVWNGFLEKDSWRPEEPVTEKAFLQMLISASRYGDAAKLLSGEDSWDGYAAIAQALGLMQNEAEEDAPLKRVAAASLLYAFMSW